MTKTALAHPLQPFKHYFDYTHTCTRACMRAHTHTHTVFSSKSSSQDFFPVVIFSMLLYFGKQDGDKAGSFLKVEMFERG